MNEKRTLQLVLPSWLADHLEQLADALSVSIEEVVLDILRAHAGRRETQKPELTPEELEATRWPSRDESPEPRGRP
ncbi:MAG TPA: hypothetical protein VFE20_01055 [Thermoleophilia bacterium]|nr:hypothetical protein [Thermoleophilia bacterium]